VTRWLAVSQNRTCDQCYGWSTDFPDRARLFAQGRRCAAIQFQMNVIEDAAPMVAPCEELDLAAITRGPLAMGVLTGKDTAGTRVPSDDVRTQVDRNSRMAGPIQTG